jgi:hypothetical protein
LKVCLIAFSLLLNPLSAQVSSLELHVTDKSSNQITVQAADSAGSPVSGATVVFHLPETNPPSLFNDGSSIASVVTDADGRAQVADIRWGAHTEPLLVRVTASKDDAHAGLLVEQSPELAAAPAALRPQPSAPRPAPGISQSAPKPVAQLPPALPESSAARDAAPVEPSATSDDSPDVNVPVRHLLASDAATGLAPHVSISTSGASESNHHIKAKWLIIGAVVAAGAAGAALALSHRGSSSSGGSSSGITIGPPGISVGNP